MKIFLIASAVLTTSLGLLSACKSEGTAQADNKKEPKLETFRHIDGTNIILAPLVMSGAPRSYSSGSTYKTGSDYEALNYLFFDLQTKSPRWLVPTTNQLFFWYRELRIPKDSYGSIDPSNQVSVEKPTALMFLLTSRDTNDDQLLNAKDQKQIALCAPSGEEYNIVIEEIESYYGTYWSGETIVTIVKRRGELQAVELDLLRQEVKGETMLPQTMVMQEAE